MRNGATRQGAPQRRDSTGFTLIEVGVAVALFSFVLLAAGGMLTAMSTGSSPTRVKTTETFHLQKQVEAIYETDYAALVNGLSDTTMANGIVLRAAWEVKELVPNKLKQVDVRVRALSNMPGGQERAVRLFVANRSP